MRCLLAGHVFSPEAKSREKAFADRPLITGG